MVDHGAMWRRENSGSTIMESEDGLDTGEHSRSPQLRLISQRSARFEALGAYIHIAKA